VRSTPDLACQKKWVTIPSMFLAPMKSHGRAWASPYRAALSQAEPKPSPPYGLPSLTQDHKEPLAGGDQVPRPA
jgi:hypothetical protein